MSYESNPDPYLRLKWKRETDRLAAICELAKQCTLRAVEALAEIAEGFGNSAAEQKAARTALAQWGTHEDWDTLAQIFRLGSERSQVFALDALSKRSDPQTSKLIREATASRHPRVRLTAVKVLDLWLPHDAIQKFNDYLSDPSPEIRATAIDFLSILECRELVPQLPKLVQDGDAMVRAAAVSAVASMNTEIAYDIGTVALQDSDQRVRLAAARLLGASRRKYAVNVLVSAASWAYGGHHNDTYKEFISATVSALSNLVDLISNQHLLEIANSDQYAQVTEWAVKELEKRGDSDALKRCCANLQISHVAGEALKRLHTSATHTTSLPEADVTKTYSPQLSESKQHEDDELLRHLRKLLDQSARRGTPLDGQIPGGRCFTCKGVGYKRNGNGGVTKCAACNGTGMERNE